MKKISDFKRKQANQLRTNETLAEQKLWKLLKQLELNDTHFRRQVPFGKYIVDFACYKHKLIIE